MKIDLHNYEAFFLDYKEGNLSAAQEKELFVFLEIHPELKAELDSFEEFVLEPEMLFENKSSLKKEDFSDEALIAYTEGVADAKSKRQIEEIASQNTDLKKELALYSNAVLVADAEIKFPNKSKLKRGGVIIYLQSNPVYFRMAAAILLLVGLFFLVAKVNQNADAENIKPVLADDSKKQIETPVKNNNTVQLPKEKAPNLALANEENVKLPNQNLQAKQIKKNDTPIFATNTVISTNTIAVNNPVNNPDTVSTKNIPAINTTLVDNNTYKSYYNYSSDADEEKEPVTASVTPAKKTFFQKLAGAARKVNEFGVKNVKGEEKQNTNLLSIGGLVVSETVSN